ncbi:uncharacterized protein fam169ab isoform X2 [Paramormyrops kingsleyae]|uniref:Family with sequence similarity 169 member A n=2 Tax=Paramormyrops kingsleyae TaxID=1676925 RepID=A0A3B3THX3_9TELE|nr:soluble lamin-associated protein of 75 kDa isoform X2 [Paramormyrops kingsleyae]
MEFVVDILGAVSHGDLEKSAEQYMSDLLRSNPDKPEYFTLPKSRQIPLSLPNMGFVPIYGADLKRKVLALFAPEDQFTAVALYLADQWWPLEEILKTSDSSREGLLKVKTLGERIVLYVLNRLVYRAKEIDKNEVPFLCHSETDYAKVLWKDGEAIGFYSVKPKGSLCSSLLTQCYLLPVMDSIFVRKAHRGNGHGLQMLEDFVDSFKEDALGLKYPVSSAMFKVCGCYLSTYPADQDLLWEVESVGGPFQRFQVASKIQQMSVEGAESLNEDVTEIFRVERSPESMKEVDVLNEHIITTEGTEDTTVSTCTRSSEFKRKRLREEAEDTKEILPEKINRVEEAATETVTPSEELVEVQEGEKEQGDEDGMEVMSSDAPVHKETQDKAQAGEAGLLREPEQVNGDQASSVGEVESDTSEGSMEPAALQENGALGEGEESHQYAEGVAEHEEPIDASVEQPERTAPPESPPEIQVEDSPEITVEAPSSIEEATSQVEKEIPLEAENEAPSSKEESTSPVVNEDLPMKQQIPAITKDKVSEQAEVKKAETNEKDPGSTEHSILDMPKEVDIPVEILSSDKVTEEKTSHGAEAVEEDAPDMSVELADDDLSQDTVLLVGLKEVSYQLPVNENEEELAEETEQQEELEGDVCGEDGNVKSGEVLEAVVQKDSVEEEDAGEMMKEEIKGDERGAATGEETDSAEKDSNDVMETPVSDMRVLRKRTARVIQAPPTRKSKRLSRPPGDDEAEPVEAFEEPEEEHEEEMAEEKVEMTEEKAPKEDEEEDDDDDEEEEEEEEEKARNAEEAAEKSSDDGEEPPVVDRRGLRRKAKVVQSPSKPKPKRRSKT